MNESSTEIVGANQNQSPREKDCNCCVPICCCSPQSEKPVEKRDPCKFQIFASRVEVIDNKQKLDRRLDLIFSFIANGVTAVHPSMASWMTMPAKTGIPVVVNRYITTVEVPFGSIVNVPLYAEAMDIDWQFPDRPEMGSGGPSVMSLSCGMSVQEVSVDVQLRKISLSADLRAKVRIYYVAVPV